jgi:hypothetical protein
LLNTNSKRSFTLSYYIIGSKYGDTKDGYTDIFPDLLKKSVVAVGFNFDDDLSQIVGLGAKEVRDYLKMKSASTDSISALKHFLNLNPGDIIAIKRHSSPKGKQARLVIGAYAVVKGVNSVVYEHCNQLGHTIAVDFIDTELDLELALGYGLTIHKVTDNDRINVIFSPYNIIEEEVLTSETKLKNTNEVLVISNASYIQTKLHNKIQNALVVMLEENNPSANIKVEENYIDVSMESDNEIILYEVKSSKSADHCIREALGQILKYGWDLNKTTNKPIRYVIVGPSNIDDVPNNYLSYIQQNFKERIDYLKVELN